MINNILKLNSNKYLISRKLSHKLIKFIIFLLLFIGLSSILFFYSYQELVLKANNIRDFLSQPFIYIFLAICIYLLFVSVNEIYQKEYCLLNLNRNTVLFYKKKLGEKICKVIIPIDDIKEIVISVLEKNVIDFGLVKEYHLDFIDKQLHAFSLGVYNLYDDAFNLAEIISNKTSIKISDLTDLKDPKIFVKRLF